MLAAKAALRCRDCLACNIVAHVLHIKGKGVHVAAGGPEKHCVEAVIRPNIDSKAPCSLADHALAIPAP